jgi:predicted O-methyltransferase YrrM
VVTVTLEADFDVVWRSSSRIDGWLTTRQARRLYEEASRVAPGAWIVEIGSHHGRSTTVLAAGKPDEVHLLAVDPFDDSRWGGGPSAFHTFEANIARLAVPGVETFRGLSSEAATAWPGNPIGLLFIDGAHDRESVLQDVDGWKPYLAEGATVIFHDAFSSIGVTKAITQRILTDRSLTFRGSERSLVVFQHEFRAIPSFLVNRFRLVTRYVWFLRNLLIKFALRRGWRPVAAALGDPEGAYLY